MNGVYGMCTHCGAIEIQLDQVDGYRDFSDIGEHIGQAAA